MVVYIFSYQFDKERLVICMTIDFQQMMSYLILCGYNRQFLEELNLHDLVSLYELVKNH